MNSNTQYVVTSINVAMVKSTNQTYPNIKTHYRYSEYFATKINGLYKQIKKRLQKNIMNLNDSNKLEWTLDHEIFIFYNAKTSLLIVTQIISDAVQLNPATHNIEYTVC